MRLAPVGCRRDIRFVCQPSWAFQPTILGLETRAGSGSSQPTYHRYHRATGIRERSRRDTSPPADYWQASLTPRFWRRGSSRFPGRGANTEQFAARSGRSLALKTGNLPPHGRRPPRGDRAALLDHGPHPTGWGSTEGAPGRLFRCSGHPCSSLPRSHYTSTSNVDIKY